MGPQNQPSRVRKRLVVDDASVRRKEAVSEAAAPVLQLLKLAGSGLWKGDLAEIRDDTPPARS
jgi:hypothetical protein